MPVELSLSVSQLVSRVVLPQPAEAESRVSRCESAPSSWCSNRSRATSAVGTRGRASLVEQQVLLSWSRWLRRSRVSVVVGSI